LLPPGDRDWGALARRRPTSRGPMPGPGCTRPSQAAGNRAAIPCFVAPFRPRFCLDRWPPAGAARGAWRPGARSRRAPQRLSLQPCSGSPPHCARPRLLESVSGLPWRSLRGVFASWFSVTPLRPGVPSDQERSLPCWNRCIVW
jgi:hypothetical protein